MYKIFDLHNDYFLKIRSDQKKNHYIDKKSVAAQSIVSAVWTSELSCDESMREIERAKTFINSNKKLFLGVEDLHFLNKYNLEINKHIENFYQEILEKKTDILGISNAYYITSITRCLRNSYGLVERQNGNRRHRSIRNRG